MTIRLLQTLQYAPSTKQMLTDRHETIKKAKPCINATDQTPDHKLYQTLQNAPNTKETLTDGHDTTKTLQKR